MTPRQGKGANLRLLEVLWLPKRRRKRAAANSHPLIASGWYAWGDTEPGWVDNYMTIEFGSEPVPAGVFEIWEHDLNNALRLLDTITCEGVVDYRHVKASQAAGTFYYKVRYRRGAAVGPFSNEFAVVVNLP